MKSKYYRLCLLEKISQIALGGIVAASIWDEILKAEPEKRFELLDQIVFLEDGAWGRIENISETRNRR